MNISKRLFPPSHVRNKKREAWQALKRRSSSYRSDREKKYKEYLSSGMQMLAFEPKYILHVATSLRPRSCAPKSEFLVGLPLGIFAFYASSSSFVAGRPWLNDKLQPGTESDMPIVHGKRRSIFKMKERKREKAPPSSQLEKN